MRLTILAIVIVWLIPTVGVLVTSFRPEELVDTTGWWTAFAHPFDAAQWTIQNYKDALDAGGFGNAFLNSLAVAIPATVIPILIAAFAAYAFAWMDFRGRTCCSWCGRPAGGPAPDGADPDPSPVHRRGDPLPGADLPGPRPNRHLPGGLAGPRRVRAAVGHLPAAQLHRPAAVPIFESA